MSVRTTQMSTIFLSFQLGSQIILVFNGGGWLYVRTDTRDSYQFYNWLGLFVERHITLGAHSACSHVASTCTILTCDVFHIAFPSHTTSINDTYESDSICQA